MLSSSSIDLNTAPCQIRSFRYTSNLVAIYKFVKKREYARATIKYLYIICIRIKDIPDCIYI